MTKTILFMPGIHRNFFTFTYYLQKSTKHKTLPRKTKNRPVGRFLYSMCSAMDGWVLCIGKVLIAPSDSQNFLSASRLWQTNPSIATAWLRRRTFFAFWQKRVLIKIILSHAKQKTDLLVGFCFGCSEPFRCHFVFSKKRLFFSFF